MLTMYCHGRESASTDSAIWSWLARNANGDKSNLLPAPVHVTTALGRGRTVLETLAASIDWPSQFDRTASAARGMYSTQPAGTPMWLRTREFEYLAPDFGWTTASDEVRWTAPSDGSRLKAGDYR